MLHIGKYVTRDGGLIGQVYGESTEPDGFGGSYRMVGVYWSNGLKTAVHENNLVETDMG